MKRKIEKYLSSKEQNSYSELDKILDMYISGKIKKILSSYEGIGIYPTFNKHGKSIQINYNFNNIYVTIDFFEDKYNVVIYPAGISIDDLEKLFIDYDYPENFNLIQLIEEINQRIKNHPQLKDTTLLRKKRKLYSLIAWISWCLPIIIFGSIGLYVVITHSSVQLNMWWILFCVIPLIIGCLFDIKSKRIK